MLYTLSFASCIEKQLKQIPKATRKLIFDRIEKLAINPRPENVEPLQGSEKGLFRIRQGDYRIVYQVQDKKLIILIVRVVHRREVYSKKHSSS
ncbi:MAG: type II toxin-antitoxin system RelE family toxin [Parachlamydiaceae bacterium]